MDPAPPPPVGSIFGSVDTSKLLGSDSDEEVPAAAAAAVALPPLPTRPPLIGNPMAAELHPKVAAAMRVVTRLRPENPVEVFAGALLGQPEPAAGGGKRDGGVAAFLTANVTGLVTEAMTRCLLENPPPADPAVFVAEYLQSKQ